MTCVLSAINVVRTQGDSCGGEVTCVVRGCPRGLGSPVFGKLEADLASALMSLPATKAPDTSVLHRSNFNLGRDLKLEVDLLARG